MPKNWAAPAEPTRYGHTVTSPLEHRTWTLATADPASNPETIALLRTVYQGFVGEDPNDARLEVMLRDAYAAGWRLRGVHDPQAPAYALDQPVATFITFDQTLNVGGEAPLPVTAISDVTVRATHRRRGLLRAMMTAELDAARDRGHALAALTVSEATIYGRFGFGPTTFTHAIAVDTGHGFALRHAPGGAVHAVDRETGSRLGAEVFDRVHRTRFGSMGRSSVYVVYRSGEFHHETGQPALKRRNAVHTDDSGTVDGWVAYEAEGEGRTLRVHDLVAATDDAYLALWQFLGAIDLVEEVVWRAAPVDDVLPWALVDPRGYRITDRHDGVWTRVLDPVAVLQARGYGQETGRLTIAVDDPLGYADGTVEVEVSGGEARAGASDAEPDLRCGIEELGPLVLGGVDPRVLAAAGRVAGSRDALERAHALFGALGRPSTTTHF